MSAVELTPQQARYLSVLAAQDIRTDRMRGMDETASRHLDAWQALQPACEWPDPDGEP